MLYQNGFANWFDKYSAHKSIIRLFESDRIPPK